MTTERNPSLADTDPLSPVELAAEKLRAWLKQEIETCARSLADINLVAPHGSTAQILARTRLVARRAALIEALDRLR